MNRDALELNPELPFRLDLTAWTLRRRPHNIVDRLDGATYRRVLPLPAGSASGNSARAFRVSTTESWIFAIENNSFFQFRPGILTF